MEKVLDIFSIYEIALGLKLNMESRNVEPQKKDLLQMKLKFKTVEEHDKYLGLPTYNNFAMEMRDIKAQMQSLDKRMDEMEKKEEMYK